MSPVVAVPRSCRRRRGRERVPRDHDPRQVRAETDDHRHAAETKSDRRADADEDLQAEQWRETQADAQRERRRRAVRRIADGRQVIERAA